MRPGNVSDPLPQAGPAARLSVLGARIAAVDYDGALAEIAAAVRSRANAYVCVANVHTVTEGLLCRGFRDRMNGSLLSVPDGMPIVWALRFLHRARLPDRVYGPELTRRLLARAASERWRVYLYGSSPGTLEALKKKIAADHPSFVLAGAESPPFRTLSDEEDEAACRRISEAKPDLVFVGLGAPKQEIWMAEHAAKIPGVLLGVGAAFDFLAGTKRQAPVWMQKRGLEWLFRFGSEPLRLWRRYLVRNPLFLAAIFLQKIGVLRWRQP
ncbi:MAG: WecB/TagA/CpsF family glycosyltransferase [Planctomycetota bacterium]|mgnify:CR=1 FL=1